MKNIKYWETDLKMCKTYLLKTAKHGREKLRKLKWENRLCSRLENSILLSCKSPLNWFIDSTSTKSKSERDFFYRNWKANPKIHIEKLLEQPKQRALKKTNVRGLTPPNFKTYDEARVTNNKKLNDNGNVMIVHCVIQLWILF